jgi:hypothetical protein
MLCDIWSTVRDVSEATPILAAAEAGHFPVAVSEENFWLQETVDLGYRIESILRRALREAPAAIALGADSPLVTANHLRKAFQELRYADSVIGPSCDGGFYLLGLRRCPSGLLQRLPWSTAETRQKTEERLYSQGMIIGRLETLSDIDTLADLQSLHAQLQIASPGIAPATRQWFTEHSSFLRELQWSAS